MIAAVGGFSLVAVAATLIGQANGVDMSGGIWPPIVLTPLIGLPIAFILIVVFLVMTVRKRARLARDNDE